MIYEHFLPVRIGPYLENSWFEIYEKDTTKVMAKILISSRDAAAVRNLLYYMRA